MNDPVESRLHALDAVRGFALLLGVAFHAALSFVPGLPPGRWAASDVSQSPFLGDAAFVSHIFRMSLFFFIAGFFARLLHRRLGTRGFWRHRLKRIAVPMVAGWLVLAPTIVVLWWWGLKRQFGDLLGSHAPAMPEDWFPLTHLWFLYYLLILYALALAVRAIVVRADAAGGLRAVVDRLVEFALRWPLAVFVLGLPLAAVLANLPRWALWQGIPTPDSTLTPQLAALVGYGTAFAFGWLVHRSREALPALAARWPVHLAIGIGATLFLLHILHVSPLDMKGAPKIAIAAALGVAAWGIALGLTGAALRFLADPSPARRYIADASYWIYLAHLPLVAWAQVLVAPWPVSWLLKFPLVLVASLAVLFASYHYLVRSTFIGAWLNGRRYARRHEPPSAEAGSTRPGMQA